jgi:ribosomal protein S18 acetylase RimI-like enzyme
VLVTGWEADVPVTDSLVRRFLHAMADRGAATAAAGGHRAERTADASFVDLGSPVGLDNAVVLLRPPPAVDLDAVIRQARAFFPPDRNWTLVSAFPLPPHDRYGLGLVGHPPLMVRAPAPLPARPSGLDVVGVDGPERLADMERVLESGFGVKLDEPALGPELPEIAQLFVGYADGRAVACAGSWAAHGIAEVNWVATVPEARRCGYGAALTVAAVAAWPGLPAALLSSDDGRPVYHRLGFLDVVRFTMWQQVAPGGSRH